MKQVRRVALLLLAAAVLSAAALKTVPLPWFWLSLIWAAAGLMIAALSPRRLQLTIVTVFSLWIALALAELLVDLPPQVHADVIPPLDRYDAVLGWRPTPSQVSRGIATLDGEVLFDVSYSIDAAGHRISPPDRGTDIEGCLWFFPDSFVFGHGVEDREAFPYQVGVKTGGRFRVVNFSVGGYGAEHMLAAIERGELASAAPCNPTHIFYSAVPDHIPRAAGKTSFSIRGPRYHIGSDGALEYLGTPFAAPDMPQWQKRLIGQLSKSRVYSAIAGRPPATTDADTELYFAIVTKAFRRMEERWPGAKRHVIVWGDIHDFYARGQKAFHDGLPASGVTTHFIDQILPGYSTNHVKYSIHRFELHPNALAHEMVASYLAEHVISSTSRAATH